MTDDNGIEVKSGDWVFFCYGIPPVAAVARVSLRDGQYWITTLGKHKPRQMKLNGLRDHVGSWYITEEPGND